MSDAQKQRILVADDDPAARTLVRRRLEAEGYDVSVAEDGQVALATIERDRPDLVILDLMMPRLDGREVIQDLRSRPETQRLPVIMVSAQGATGATSANGADAYFAKPLDFTVLFDQIEGLLARTRAGGPSAAGAAARGDGGATGLVTFVGAKGGVGTTTIAANAAVALARAGQSTILVEAASFHGTVPTMLGIPARRRMDRLPLHTPAAIDAAAVAETLLNHTSGLRVMLGPTGTQAPPTADGVIALLDAIKGLADNIIVDLDDAVGVIGQVALRIADQVWVVTTPDPTSVERTEALIQTMEQWGVRPRRIHLLVNRTTAAVGLDPEAIARQAERPVELVVPSAPEACFDAGRQGVALVELAPDQPVANAIGTLAGILGTVGASV